MLGYEVDFGHMEIIALISSGKFSEKNVGYVAVSLLMKSEDEMMTLVVNSVRNDLVSHNNYFQVGSEVGHETACWLLTPGPSACL